MKDSWKFISNPFYKVAGYKAAGWGILGIVITTVIAYGADVHFHGLLHYGGAPHSEWWESHAQCQQNKRQLGKSNCS